MSAVDDVEARIRRLDDTRAAKSTQLRLLQQELRYNSIAGVDERCTSGVSVAQLEIKVERGRNMLFKAGFLSSQRTYVRVTVEVMVEQLKSTTVVEQHTTTSRPISGTPQWSETLLFQGLPAAIGTIRVDVMQEERIGADERVGTFLLPLARLQDQRKMDKWFVLETYEKSAISELLVGCLFQRSPISALELQLELLQNQINELHLFLGRHQNLVGLVKQDPQKSSVMTSAQSLQGKEVGARDTPEQTVSTRFSAVASFPPAMRKRELGEDMGGKVETTRVKRQRVDAEKQENSFSDRIVNWLLPASTASTTAAASDAASQKGVCSTEESAGNSSSQFFPFKQRRTASAPRRTRRAGRPLFATPPKTPTALQAIEKWLFTDKDGNPRDLPFGRQASSY